MAQPWSSSFQQMCGTGTNQKLLDSAWCCAQWGLQDLRRPCRNGHFSGFPSAILNSRNHWRSFLSKNENQPTAITEKLTYRPFHDVMKKAGILLWLTQCCLHQGNNTFHIDQTGGWTGILNNSLSLQQVTKKGCMMKPLGSLLLR